MTSLERLTAKEASEELSKINGRGKWKRRNKFNAVRTMIGELRFDSKKEANDYLYFMRLKAAGEIRDYRRQVRFELSAHSLDGPVKLCTYVADHVFFDVKKNCERVVDSKGVKTALFKLKAKLMKANHGIEVELM